jgi:hypothetical protein
MTAPALVVNNTLAPPRPSRPEIFSENVPADLRARRTWVCWRYELVGAKWTKVPLRADGRRASSTDPATWTTFDAALAAVQAGRADGIGLAFDGVPRDDGMVLVGVDFDNLTISPDGAVVGSTAADELAREFEGRFATYAEISPSGGGLHLLGWAPPLSRAVTHKFADGSGVELYSGGRYFTVTGNGSGNLLNVTEPFAALAAEVGRHKGQRTPSTAPSAIARTIRAHGITTGVTPNLIIPATFASDDDPAEFSGGVTDVARIESALLAIPPEYFADREQWRDIMFSVAFAAAVEPRHADELYRAFDRACARPGAGNYNEGDNHAQFNAAVRGSLGRPGAITLGTLFDIAYQHGWAGAVGPALAGPITGSAAGSGAATPFSPSTPIAPAAVGGVQPGSMQVRRRRTLVGGVATRGYVTLLAARSKIGKSTFTCLLAMALATGVRLTGGWVWQPAPDQQGHRRAPRILILNSEDDANDTLAKFQAAMILHGVSTAALAGITIIGSDTLPDVVRVLVQNGPRGQPVINEAALVALEVMMAGYDLVILDPLLAFCAAGQNDNATMAQVMLRFAAIARRHDQGLIVVHHFRKGSSIEVDGTDAAAGASALVNHARIVLGMRLMTEAEAPKMGVLPSQSGNFVGLHGMATNLTAAAADVTWFARESVPIPGTAQPPEYPDDDHWPALRLWTPGTVAALLTPAALDAARNAIAAAAGQQQWLSPNRQAGDRWAVPVVAAAIEAAMPGGGSPTLAQAAIDALVAGGTVGVAKVRVPKAGGGGANMRDGYIIANAAAGASTP